jgi:hypothetical protein
MPQSQLFLRRDAPGPSRHHDRCALPQIHPNQLRRPRILLRSPAMNLLPFPNARTDDDRKNEPHFAHESSQSSLTCSDLLNMRFLPGMRAATTVGVNTKHSRVSNATLWDFAIRKMRSRAFLPFNRFAVRASQSAGDVVTKGQSQPLRNVGRGCRHGTQVHNAHSHTVSMSAGTDGREFIRRFCHEEVTPLCVFSVDPRACARIQNYSFRNSYLDLSCADTSDLLLNLSSVNPREAIQNDIGGYLKLCVEMMLSVMCTPPSSVTHNWLTCATFLTTIFIPRLQNYNPLGWPIQLLSRESRRHS